MPMHGRRQRRSASAAMVFCLVAGYLFFATAAATCVDHQPASHHHAGQAAHHHPLCGETQCSGAAIVTDGLSAPADLPRLCGTVALPAVSPVSYLFLSFAASRAPPLPLA